MSTDLVIRDDGLAPEVIGSAYSLAEKVARTEFVPGSLRGKPEAIMACILMGREIGVGPMQALSKIHVVDGRPAMAAELMRARALDAGHDIWIEEKSSTRVVVCGQRRGSDKVSKVTWTMDDAKRAGIAGKNNWRKYPRAMLTARATAELCRDVFADCLGGVSYSVEELEDGGFGDGGDGEPVEVEPKPAAARTRGTVRRQAPAAQRAHAGLPPLPHEISTGGTDDDDVVDAEIVEDGDDQDSDDGFELLTKAQLQLRLKRADLPVSGTKDELIGRLRDHASETSGGGETEDQAPAAEASAPTQPPLGAAGDADTPGSSLPPDARPFDRDGAQRAFHAQLHELGLDYETQVRPWMQQQYQATLSKLDDGRLRKLLDAMDLRPMEFVVAVQEHAETNATGEADPGPSLAERAHAHAAGQSDAVAGYQARIREAWRVLAVHNETVYQGGWERAEKITGGRAGSSDWSGSSEAALRALAVDMERAAVEAGGDA